VFAFFALKYTKKTFFLHKIKSYDYFDANRKEKQVVYHLIDI